MEAEQQSKNAPRGAQQLDKLYMENNLVRISGALFCHDAKRAATHTQEIAITRGGDDKTIIIRPDPRLGQPGPLAHKVFLALIKKHSDYGQPIQKEISFTKREIMRMVGRKTWSGRHGEQLSRALHEIHHAFITTRFRNASGRYVEHSFNIFPEIWIERREFASDPIEACTVTLAEPIVASLQDDHFTCLNHHLLGQLGTIGQALYIRLFFHLANLYDGANRQRLILHKRYDDICVEWLGGLTILQHKSKIAGEQLGRHLDQLVEAGFLDSYTIASARTQGSGGFVLAFYPGPAFFRDYDRFYRRRQFDAADRQPQADTRQAGAAMKVAYMFAERRTGAPAGSIPFVSSKDVDTARQLLDAISLHEMPTFFDYALVEARKTDFDVQTLGGIKQYLPSYRANRVRQAATQIESDARQVRERDEAQRLEYDRFRRAEAADMFAALPQSEQAIIEEHAHAHASKFSGSLRDSMFAFGKVRFTIERHQDRLTAFEQWRASQHR